MDLVEPLMPPPAKRGRKRHVFVDVLGLIFSVVVTSALIDDGTAAPLVMEKVTVPSCPRMELIWGDGKYNNKGFKKWLDEYRPDWRLEVNEGKKEKPASFRPASVGSWP